MVECNVKKYPLWMKMARRSAWLEDGWYALSGIDREFYGIQEAAWL